MSSEIAAILLFLGASLAQLWVGWPFALMVATIVWVWLYGQDIIAGQMAKAAAAQASCPYCEWDTPHKKGNGCAQA